MASRASAALASARSSEKPDASSGTGTARTSAMASASRVPMKPGSSIHAAAPASRITWANTDRLCRTPVVITTSRAWQVKPRAMPR